jgi:MGT family glycosyltransferase
VPGHGHVIPSLPFVDELTRRGHQIIYFCAEGYRAGIEAAGAEFRAYSGVEDDYFESRGLSGSVPQRVAYQLITTSAEILPELLEIAHAEKPDAIFFDSLCPWGWMVARILKLPAITSLVLPPITSPPPLEMLKMLPVFLPVMFRDIGKGFEASRRARALTDKYHLPPYRMTVYILNNIGDLTISYTSREFQVYADTVPSSVRFVGWTLNETPSNGAFSFEGVKGRKLVYISLGTLNNDDIGFFKTCIEAFTGSEYYVIMTTGKRIRPEAFGALPENIAIFQWVPQVEVVKQAAMFISHGGLNSIHDSLYLNVPMLLVPQQSEQTLNAMRVVELGAGLMLKKPQMNAQTIRESARRLLTEDRFKAAAARVGETFRTAGGAAKAADEVEALVGKG